MALTDPSQSPVHEGIVRSFVRDDAEAAGWVDPDRIKAEVRMLEDMEERREVCSAEGHCFAVITVFQSADPQSVVCTNCGASWRVAGRVLGRCASPLRR